MPTLPPPVPNSPAATPPATSQRRHMVALSLLGFVLMASYAIARPATESIFLATHTSKGLPLAWIWVALGMVAAVTLYNRFVGRFELMGLFAGVAALSAGLLAALLRLRALGLPGVDYALFVWKDLHIVILIEIYYSFANAVFPIKTARWLYGWLGVLGSTGAVLGSLAVGPIAKTYGSVAALSLSAPLLLVIGLLAAYFLRGARGIKPQTDAGASSGMAGALKVVRSSSYLALIAALIILVQVVITLVDFQFNHAAELAYPDQDIRTGIVGQVYGAVSVATFVLHALTGALLRLTGVPLMLLGIPLLLGAAVTAMAFSSRFALAAFVKVASKTLDYTVFRAAKEILYIPLSYAEKTAGKSIADMLTYRVAKGGASLLLIGIGASGALLSVSGLTLAAIGAWFLTTIAVARRFRQQVSRAKEMGHS